MALGLGRALIAVLIVAMIVARFATQLTPCQTPAGAKLAGIARSMRPLGGAERRAAKEAP
jgi:hypothetical protein